MASIKVKQVIAGQPITRSGSRCTEECDIENHHTHVYCKMCKRNLFYGTVVHDCLFGFDIGKHHPDMNPRYLVNTPWWTEPLEIQQENLLHYLECFKRRYHSLPVYPPRFSLDPVIVDFD